MSGLARDLELYDGPLEPPEALERDDECGEECEVCRDHDA